MGPIISWDSCVFPLLHLEFGDPAAGANGPSSLRRDYADRVVIAGVERLPIFAAVGRYISAGWPGSDPYFAIGEVSDGGTESLRRGACGHCPGFATVGRNGDIARCVGCLGVVSADCDSVSRAGELDRKY